MKGKGKPFGSATAHMVMQYIRKAQTTHECKQHLGGLPSVGVSLPGQVSKLAQAAVFVFIKLNML